MSGLGEAPLRLHYRYTKSEESYRKQRGLTVDYSMLDMLGVPTYLAFFEVIESCRLSFPCCISELVDLRSYSSFYLLTELTIAKVNVGLSRQYWPGK